MTDLAGTPVSPGVSIGTAVVVETANVDKSGRTITVEEVGAEVARFRQAVEEGVQELRRLQGDLAGRVGKDEAAIFEAQSMMIQDPGLAQSVLEHLKADLVSAERAVRAACEEHAQMLQTIDDPYLAARAMDLRDIGRRLVRILTGGRDTAMPKDLPQQAVIVASDLTPSDTASLDVDKVAAMVLDKGGRTSHTAILARSLGIPAVVGTGVATSVVHSGDLVAVDGEAGQVTVNPDESALSALRGRAQAFAEERRRLARLRDLPGITLDGKKIELGVNIGNTGDVDVALKAGAEGVGLFRTEFLFIDRDDMPGEEEQFASYRRVLSAFAPRPVVIRTLDAGGDKRIPYLDLSEEGNPFLGLRAIRLCLYRRDVFRIQLRALLRASAYGRLRIMFPMISGVGELREAKAEMERAREELAAEGVKTSPDIQVGIMVEVPSAAVDADLLAAECDFFSIGTNDLVQYTVACDRGNPSVAYLSDPFTPAVLRLIARTVEEGHKRGIWVGMCGEMAGMPEAIPLLVAIGLDELSMSAGALPRAKETVRSLDAGALARVWEDVRKMATSDEVKHYLKRVCG